MYQFKYHPDLIKRYPTLIGGVILAHGLKNSATSEELRVHYETELQSVITQIGSKPLSEIVSLAAWRNAFRGFGVDPTQYRSAPEALLRRLTKQGNIPSINTRVDIGNLVSIRYGLPITIFDTRVLQGGVTVHFADGTERYTPLGEQQAVEHPEAGEVVFTDESKLVIARRWCWRQADQSAARLNTMEAIITVEVLHINSMPHVLDTAHPLV